MSANDLVDAVRCPYCGSSKKKFKWNYFDDARLAWNKNIRVFRCKHCNLVYSHIWRDTTATNYDENYYIFQKHREAADRAFARHCAEWLSRHTTLIGKNVLDVGCGNGYFCEEAKNNGAFVVGIEPSVLTGYTVEKRLGIKVIKALLEEAEIEGHPFDIITMWDVLEHSLTPAKMIHKTAGLLKTGGILVISVPNVSSIFSFVAGPFWKGYNPYHISHLSIKTLCNILQEAGFRALSLETCDTVLFSGEGLYRLGLKERLKSIIIKVPMLRDALISRRTRLKPTPTFTGHNDYVSPPKNGFINSTLEKILKKMKMGDQIRVLAQKQ